MIETLDQLAIAAEPLIVRGRRAWHGTLYALVWVESADRWYAWHEHRVLAVTVAAYPDRVAAADAGRRLWGGAPSRCRQCGAQTRNPARCIDCANDAEAGDVPD